MKNYFLLAATAFCLVSCGDNQTEESVVNEPDLMDQEMTEEFEEIVVLEDKEYGLNELLELHYTTDFPEQIEDHWVDFWFIQAETTKNQTASVNDSTTYAFRTHIDPKYKDGGELDGNASLTFYADPSFYAANPSIIYEKDDTVHGKGIFINDRMKGIRIERYTPSL